MRRVVWRGARVGIPSGESHGVGGCLVDGGYGWLVGCVYCALAWKDREEGGLEEWLLVQAEEQRHRGWVRALC